MITNLKHKWECIPDVTKASVVFMIVNFMTEGIRFLITPIYTRLLSPEEYGITAVFYSWESILGVFAMLSLQYGIFNNGMFEFRNDRSRFISSLLLLSNLATTILLFMWIILKKHVVTIIGLSSNLMLLMAFTFYIKPAYSFWVSRQRYEYKYKGPAFITLFLGFFAPIAGILGVLYLPGNKAEIKLWMSQFPFLIVWGLFYIKTYLDTHFNIKKEYILFAFKLSIPLIPHYASQYILSASDKIMISLLVDDASAGIYGLSSIAGSVVSIIWNSINAVLAPWTYEKMGNKDYNSIYKVTGQLCILYGGACASIMLVAPEIMKVVAPSSYMDGVYLIPLIIAATYLSGVFSLFGNIELFYKKVNLVMFASSSAAVLNIFLNFLFINQFGYFAAAYTTVFCYIAYTFFHYYNMKSIEKNSVYNIKQIFLCSICVILLSFICRFLYSHIILRYFLVLVFIGMVLLYHNYIVNLLKRIKR